MPFSRILHWSSTNWSRTTWFNIVLFVLMPPLRIIFLLMPWKVPLVRGLWDSKVLWMISLCKFCLKVKFLIIFHGLT